MKLKFLSFFSFVFLLSCGGDEVVENETGQTQTDSTAIVEHELNEKRLSAVDYNNELSAIFSATISSVDRLFASDSGNVEHNLENTLFEMDVNAAKLEDIATDAEGEEFKEALKALLSFYAIELEHGFAEIVVPILTKGELSKVDQNDLEAFDKDFSAAEEPVVEAVIETQRAFAEANNIKLME